MWRMERKHNPQEKKDSLWATRRNETLNGQKNPVEEFADVAITAHTFPFS